MDVRSIDGLTIASPGIAVLRAVMNEHWRRLVADYLALPSPPSRDAWISAPPRAPARVSAHEAVVPGIVRALLARDPRLVVRVLRRPILAGLVGAARRTPLHDIATQRRLVAELDLLVAYELAVLGVLPTELVFRREPRGAWPSGEAWLRSMTARTAGPLPDEEELHVGAHVKPLALRPAYFEIVPGIDLATSDNNPLLAVQAHPERPGNVVGLGDRPLDEWLERLRDAFAIIERHAPAVFDEMRLALELVVPVGYQPERHASVSYRDSVGAVYMTLHPKVMTIAEALIHEFQHNKLNAVLHFDDVLVNAREEGFVSPVRPDPRPLIGVLMAGHAFLPVARLYEAMMREGHPLARGHDFEKRYRAIVETNREAVETVVRYGRATRLGEGLLGEMKREDRSCLEVSS